MPQVIQASFSEKIRYCGFLRIAVLAASASPRRMAKYACVAASSPPCSPVESTVLGFFTGASITSTFTTPSAWCRAVSRESARRRWMPALTTSRSTTMSMSCFFFLSSSKSSDRSRIWPSTTTRVKPSLRSWFSSFLYSPLRPRIMGESSVSFVPPGSIMIWSTIWETVCEVISLPQQVQWGCPIRAKSRRR